mmetsp:Transcript_22516/g.30835  ORF Transcript_22516/g.30835 Transcript_22516/m.30835 type:complete len:462 (+) Transcript_22516:223-1608(+)
MNILDTAIVEAEIQNAAKEVVRQQRQKEEEALRLQRQKEEEELRLQKQREAEELRLLRLKEEADLQRLKEERLQRLKEEEEIKLQRERHQRQEEEEMRVKRLREEKEQLELKLQMEREIQKRLEQDVARQQTPQTHGKSGSGQSQGDELTPNSDSLQLSIYDEAEAPHTTTHMNTANAFDASQSRHKRSLSEQPLSSVKLATRNESPVIQDNRMRAVEASKETLRAEYHKRTIQAQQPLPTRKDLSSIRRGPNIQKDTQMEATELANQTGVHNNDDDMASVYTMSNLFGESMFAEKTTIPKSQYTTKTQSTAVTNTISQENENSLRRKYARINSENNSSQHQKSDIQKTGTATQRNAYIPLPTKHHPSQSQQRQPRKESRTTLNQLNSQSMKTVQSQKSQFPFQSQTMAAATRAITETPKSRNLFLPGAAYPSTVRPKNDTTKIPSKASPGDWFLEDEVFK